MSIEIRKALPADAEGIFKVEGICSGEPWTLPEIEEELAFSQAYTVAALQDGAIIGFCTIQYAMESAHINEFGVLPDCRRQGIGQRLLEEIFRFCRENGVQELTLEVRTGAAPARAVYDRNGFVQVGKRKNFYTGPSEDALVLKKNI